MTDKGYTNLVTLSIEGLVIELYDAGLQFDIEQANKVAQAASHAIARAVCETAIIEAAGGIKELGSNIAAQDRALILAVAQEDAYLDSMKLCFTVYRTHNRAKRYYEMVENLLSVRIAELKRETA